MLSLGRDSNSNEDNQGSPALRQIEADFSPDRSSACGDQGVVGDLFSELHVNEIRKLEHLLEKWDLLVIGARNIENKEEAIRTLLVASEELLNKSRAITIAQTSGYFQGIQLNQT